MEGPISNQQGEDGKMKITVSQLRRIIREEVEKVSRPGSFAYGGSPDWETVLRTFESLRDENGEVPEEVLASELGVEPEMIDYNGTGLRMMNGMVSEMI